MRVAASAAVTALVAGVLSGCMFVTPQQTTRSYTPSDGINATIGSIKVRNVLLITDDGQQANMLGLLSNSSDVATTVTLQYATTSGSETTTLAVPANGALSLRPNPDEQVSTSVTTQARAVQLDGLDTTAGGLLNVGLSVSGEEPVTLQVPVLTGELSEYAGLAPTPTATASSDVEPSQAVSPSPTPSATE